MNIQKLQIQLLKNEFKVTHKPQERFHYAFTKYPNSDVECTVIVHNHGVYVIESSKMFLNLNNCKNGEYVENAINYMNKDMSNTVECYDTKTVIERGLKLNKTNQRLHKLECNKEPVYLNEDDLKLFWDLSLYTLLYDPKTYLVYFYDNNNRFVGLLTTVRGVDNI